MSKISKFETRPLYLQVRDMLLGRITTGNWKPGTLIPNEIDLAREFGLSVGTVRKALDQLQTEHLLTRRQGRGTFVNDLSTDEHSKRFFRIFGQNGEHLALETKTLSVRSAPPTDAIRRALDLPTGARVITLVRLRSRDGHPRLYETSALPASLFVGLNDDEHIPSEIAALAQKYGQIAGSAEEILTIIAADADVATHLSVAPGTPLMCLERRTFAVDGAVLECCTAYCNLQGLQYRSQIA